jgi:hypothetical protein
MMESGFGSEPPEDKRARMNAEMRAYKDVIEKYEMGRALLDKHGLHDWQIVTINLNRPEKADCDCWGDMNHDHKFIRVDISVGRSFRQVVLHEIADALRGPGHGHDKEWKEIAWKIGCNANRLFPYSLPKDLSRVIE